MASEALRGTQIKLPRMACGWVYLPCRLPRGPSPSPHICSCLLVFGAPGFWLKPRKRLAVGVLFDSVTLYHGTWAGLFPNAFLLQKQTDIIKVLSGPPPSGSYRTVSECRAFFFRWQKTIPLSGVEGKQVPSMAQMG